MTTLTETSHGRHIAPSHETISMLKDKHGNELDQFWKSVYGYGTACLTNIEAGYLCRVESLAAIKNRMAESAKRARSQGLSPIALEPHP